jgi:hypothetical protein
VARFGETEEQWRRDAWSVIVEFETQPDFTWAHVVNVRMLSDAAPPDLLAPARAFDLYEGNKKVAEGTVLANLAT